jgi:hypothetical protein
MKTKKWFFLLERPLKGEDGARFLRHDMRGCLLLLLLLLLYLVLLLLLYLLLLLLLLSYLLM